MDNIFETVFSFIIEIIKYVVGGFLLFYFGVYLLRVITLFNYPVNMQLERHANMIYGVGLNGIYIFVTCVATYNNSQNIYLLVIGIAVAVIQAILIALKYYSRDREILKKIEID